MEWRVTRLGDVTELVSGYAFKSNQWRDQGVPVVKIGNVKHGELDLSGCSFVSREDAEASRFLLKKDDTLIGLTGHVGSVCRVRTSAPIALNQRVGVFRPIKDLIDKKFLYHLVFSSSFKDRVIGAAYGSAQPNVAPRQILDFKAHLPPIDEQREIAATLEALDNKLELNRRMSATLEAMARALYRSWFVDFDPVHARAEGRAPAHMDPATAALFPDRFGEEGLPEGWRTITLGVLADNPRQQAKPEAVPTETPYIGLEHLPRRSVTISDWETAEKVGSAKYRMQVGQFLFGKLRPYFHKVGLVPADGICSTDILVVEAKERTWREFVLCVISSDAFVDYANASASGTRMPRANWRDMASYEIALPPHSILEKFSQTVAPMHAKILAGIYENQTLTTLRDTLLPKLMSGELSVRDAEALVGEVA